MRNSHTLKELNFSLNIICVAGFKFSICPFSFVEAVEHTCFFPDIKIDKTDMLREGAPIRPEPKSKNWKPEAWVRLFQ